MSLQMDPEFRFSKYRYRPPRVRETVTKLARR